MVSLKSVVLGIIPKFIIRFFAKAYIGGYTVEDAINKADKLYELGIKSTLDLLDENVKTEEEVQTNLEVYLSFMEQFQNRANYMSLSIKLSALGVIFDEKLAKICVQQILKKAKACKIKVTLDMENSTYTDITLQMYTDFLGKFHDFGTVLQSRLFRTEQDIKKLQTLDRKTRIRMCVGIYKEDEEISLIKKDKMKKKLIEYSEILLKDGHYLEFATHDKNYISKFVEKVELNKYPKDKLEFQQLLGVPMRKVQNDLISSGFTIRVYLPFAVNKKRATTYLKRRLSANPSVMSFAIKHIIRRNR